MNKDEANLQPKVTVFREHVRKRPGMYIGDVGERGLHWMVFDIIANSLAEAAKGFVRSIAVSLKSDGSLAISDDGRGFPSTSHPKFGKPVLEVVMTEPSWPDQADGHSEIGRAWRNSWAYAVANSLSEWLRIESSSQGRSFAQEFRAGVACGPPTDLGTIQPTSGITVTLKPDRSIFADGALSFPLMRERLREFALLHSGVTIRFLDEVTRSEQAFHFDDGIMEFVKLLNQSRKPIHEVIPIIRGEKHGIQYEVGIQFCHEREDIVLSFVNDEKSLLGGTHVTGVRLGVTNSLKRYARQASDEDWMDGRVQWTSEGSGMTAAISIRMDRPEFAGATKAKLANKEVLTILAPAVAKVMGEFFTENSEVATAIIRAGLGKNG